MVFKVCLSSFCEDRDRIILEQQIKNQVLHKHDQSYIVKLDEIIEKRQSYQDVFSKFQRKLSDFAYLLLASQQNLKNIQVYQKNQNEFNQLMLKQCLKISQYYQSFNKDIVANQVRNLIIQYQKDQENKKSILLQINEMISIDQIIEKRVFEKILSQFNSFLQADEIKQFNDENKEQFQKYLEQKYNKIIEMRSKLINKLSYEHIELSQDLITNQYCLNYFQKLTIIYNQEQSVLNYLQSLNSKQKYSKEIKLLDTYKSKLIESLLFLVEYFSSQYDIQSTFSCFYEIYSIEIQDKDILNLMIKTVKKFNLSSQYRTVHTLSLITFYQNRDVLQDFMDNLFPNYQDKENLIDQILEISNKKNDEKIIFAELKKIIQKELNDNQLSLLMQKLTNTSNVKQLIQQLFMSFLGVLKNNILAKGIPAQKILKDSINYQDVFSYTLQKQAERKERNQQIDNDKKKNEKEKSLEKKTRRNNQEKKFENFRQLAKERRNILGHLLQKDSPQSNSQQQKQLYSSPQNEREITIQKECKKNAQEEKNRLQDILESIHIEHEYQRPCLQNSLFLVKSQDVSDSKLENSQKKQEQIEQNPFDQESFLKLFNDLKEDQLISICQKYKQIMAQKLSKNEMNSQLLSFFSASSYFYLNSQQLSKLFLDQQLKFNFNDAQRLNQLEFIQFFNKQADCSMQNCIQSLKISQDRSQWFIHAQLGFLYQYIFENSQQALYHYQASMNLKSNELSFFLLFQMGYIYYHNLNDYNMAVILFNQGFQFIKNNKLNQLNNNYFAQIILDYAILNYRIGNFEKSKCLTQNFFEQNPTKNIEIAYYLNALACLKQGDDITSLNLLQNFIQNQNLSIKVEYHILSGFIHIYQKNPNLSKYQYSMAWKILCDSQIQNKLEKHIRVLKQLIYLNQGISFYQETELNFIQNLPRNSFISYLEFLFTFAVQRYNQYITTIICHHEKQQTNSFNQEFTKSEFYQQDCNQIIQLFQYILDQNYRKVECLFLIGKCYQDLLGQDLYSLQFYNQVLKLDPFHQKSLMQILQLLIYNQNYEQANIILNQLENLQLQNPYQKYLQAKILQNQGNFLLSQNIYLQILNSSNISSSKTFYRLVQADYQFCQFEIQENLKQKLIQ